MKAKESCLLWTKQTTSSCTKTRQESLLREEESSAISFQDCSSFLLTCMCFVLPFRCLSWSPIINQCGRPVGLLSDIWLSWLLLCCYLWTKRKMFSLLELPKRKHHWSPLIVSFVFLDSPSSWSPRLWVMTILLCCCGYLACGFSIHCHVRLLKIRGRWKSRHTIIFLWSRHSHSRNTTMIIVVSLVCRIPETKSGILLSTKTEEKRSFEIMFCLCFAVLFVFSFVF